MVKKSGNIVAHSQNDGNGLCVGIDGCRMGWLAAWLNGDSALQWTLSARWHDLNLEAAAMIAVDMPIGLAPCGPRACDIAARRLLPTPRKSSVFPPPRRYMLACSSWQDAHAAGKATEGVGLSRQAWNITPKIRELDEAIAPADQSRIREVHPELVFNRLADGRPLPPKRTAAGHAARLRLLGAAGVPGLAETMPTVPKSAVARDDVLDAAACALAAQAMRRGAATRLPACPPRDERGLRMEIWF